MKRLEHKNDASLIIIAICVCVMITMHFIPYTQNDVGKDLIVGAYYKPFIACGQWWRLLTAGFVHGGILHLTMNMFALYSLGTIMESIYGKKKFLLLLLGSSVGGYLFMFINQGNVVGVGLSGGLYGLMASYIYVVIKAGGWNYPPMRKNLLEILAINFAINFVPGIGYMVHIGGFITGSLLAICFDHDPAYEKLRKNTYIALAILVVVCIKMASVNIDVDPDDRFIGTDINYLTYEVQQGHEKYASKLAEKLDDYYGVDILSYFYE